jgi:hypothetical protein
MGMMELEIERTMVQEEIGTVKEHSEREREQEEETRACFGKEKTRVLCFVIRSSFVSYALCINF